MVHVHIHVKSGIRQFCKVTDMQTKEERIEQARDHGSNVACRVQRSIMLINNLHCVGLGIVTLLRSPLLEDSGGAWMEDWGVENNCGFLHATVLTRILDDGWPGYI